MATRCLPIKTQIMSIETAVIIFLVGIAPALLWLWFWLREDRLHPEPKKLIALTFVAGMASVFFAYFIEKGIEGWVSGAMLTIVLWALTEEFLKFSAAYITAFRRKDYDEPVDALIYLITAALGFAAMENMFFIISDFIDGNFLSGFITGNLRFIGASLLHVLSSATIGVFMALSFYKRSRFGKLVALVFGLALAGTIHAAFNFYLLKNTYVYTTLLVFSSVWAAIIVLLVAFEKIKRLKSLPHVADDGKNQF